MRKATPSLQWKNKENYSILYTARFLLHFGTQLRSDTRLALVNSIAFGLKF